MMENFRQEGNWTQHAKGAVENKDDNLIVWVHKANR